MERFDESAIDWVAAAKRGISRRMLKEYGFLELLLEGGTTPVIPLTLTLADVTIKLDGTLRLTEDCDKNVRFDKTCEERGAACCGDDRNGWLR